MKIPPLFNNLSRRLWQIPVKQRRLGVLIIVVVLVGLAAFFIVRAVRRHTESSLRLTSSSFMDNQALPKQYTCDGENLSPAFTFANAPKGTQSFALLIEDVTKSDHPVHWMVWNIPSTYLTVLEGIRPAGTVARDYLGNFGYDGPCPPAGEEHTYQVHLYALDKPQLSLNSAASVKDFQSAVKAARIGESVLHTTYKRASK